MCIESAFCYNFDWLIATVGKLL